MAKKLYDNRTRAINKQIRKICYSVTNEYANRFIRYMKKKTDSVLAAYYNDYTPEMYKRTNAFKTQSYIPFKEKIGNKSNNLKFIGYRAGIQLTGPFFYDTGTRSAGEIFYDNMYLGKHGHMATTSPSPYVQLLAARDNFKSRLSSAGYSNSYIKAIGKVKW